MGLKRSSKIFPNLWYAKEAEEAAVFYASIFPDSRVDRVTPFGFSRRRRMAGGSRFDFRDAILGCRTSPRPALRQGPCRSTGKLP